MAKTYALDLDKIERLMDQRRIRSFAQLSQMAGRDRSHFSRMLREQINPSKVSLETARGYASALDVDVELLCTDFSERTGSPLTLTERPPLFASGSWEVPEAIDRFYEQLKRAQDCLVITQRMDAYLLPEDMWRWLWESWNDAGMRKLNAERLRGFWTWSEALVENQKRIRRNSSFRHTVISQEKLYNDAIKFDPRFLEDSLSLFEAHQRRTTVGLVGQEGELWEKFTARITEIFNTIFIMSIPKWDKIAIIDDYFLMIRVDSSHYLITEDRFRIVAFREKIEELSTIYCGNVELRGLNVMTYRIIRSLLKRRSSS